MQKPSGLLSYLDMTSVLEMNMWAEVTIQLLEPEYPSAIS